MKITSVLLLALFPFLSMPVLADNVIVGGERLVITAPPGYTPMTPEMSPYYELVKEFIPSSNEGVINFISSKDASLIFQKKTASLSRSFSVQVAKSMVLTPVSDELFGQLKTVFREQNSAIVEKVRAENPAMNAETSKNLGDKISSKVVFSVPDIQPLPFHLETTHSLSMSMLVHAKMSINNTQVMGEDEVQAVTMSVVHIGERVLFFYTTAPKADLEWTRMISKKWVEETLEANGESDTDLSPKS